MATYTPEPRAYELMVLLTPELDEEAVHAEIDRVSGLIAEAGGEVQSTKSTTPWGRRRLAYPIDRHLDAFYVLYTFTGQPENIAPFERELKLNSRVIRYLLIREEKTEDEEAPEEAEAADEGETAEAADDAGADEAEEAGEPETAEPVEAGDDDRA